MVGGLVQQQQVGRLEQQGRQRHAHAPAAGEIAARPLLRLGIEAEAVQDRARARRRGMRLQLMQALVDVGDAMAVGGVLRLLQQALPLGIGGQHGLQQALRPVRRFLRDAADPGAVGQADLAGVGVQVAGDQLQQGGLAGAVAPDQAGLVAAGQREAGTLQKRAPGDPAGEVGDG